ncbi:MULTISPECIES: hypothetical protein [Pseudanabaena]|uniref:Uncharacterized protein n=2 Tax=Pseudanabaena TaxID=1152 RepID=L8N303_9CYAN|nr:MULTISPECIES: hypothetical protein [Pseudanabaena]ELS33100.1 hypothetical protein Pse7429DRAFT_1634 [Pseudanabaena biceps PCC 7429]MDG3494703.1 hypothetical protein [Pseudanabaena catenata USMAC16]
MASRTLVKNYLAQWMQMGKTVILSSQNKEISIYKILQGENYSPEFNQLWDMISTVKAQEAYLSGTNQTIHDLLDNQWEIVACARCSLLVPTIDMGARVPVCCPCDDLPSHPNLDLVAPHAPVTLLSQLEKVCDRLDRKSEERSLEPTAQNENPQLPPEDPQALHNLKTSILKLIKINP